MKKYIFFITFIVCAGLCKAQTWQWAYDETAGSGTDIETDQAGNIYMLASVGNTVYGTYTLSCGPANSAIAKHDAAGNIIWARGVLCCSGVATFFSMDKTGNIYVTGFFQLNATFCGGNNPNITVTSPGSTDVFLCKYDNNGNLQWVKTWGYSYANERNIVIKTDLNGNSYVAGRSEFYDNAGDHFNFFLLKYDSSGNLLWSKTSNWKGDMFPRDIDLDEDGNYYIAGGFSDSAYFDNISFIANSPSRIFMAKYNSNGEVIWAKKDGTNYDECDGLKLDGKGNFYITGYHTNPSAFGSTDLTTGRMFLAKYDTSGTALWARSSGASRGMDLTCDSDGSCFVTGYFKSTAAFGSGINSVTLKSQKINREMFVAKYDKNGNFNWALAPGGNFGGENEGRALHTDNSGNCFLTGMFTQVTIFGSTSLSSPGGIFFAKLKDSVALLTDVKHILNSEKELIVFPNPILNSINIRYKSLDEINSLQINIRSITGQEVYSKNYQHSGTELKNNGWTVLNRGGSTTFTTNIEVEKYAMGVYFIEIIDDGKRVTRKFIVN